MYKMVEAPVSILWLAGGSCDGCTMAMLGATAPKIEELLLGQVSGFPAIEMIHPITALEAGTEYLAKLESAASGGLSPLVLVVEGSLFDSTQAGDGFFSGMGERNGKPCTVMDWLDRLTPQATAVIAIGTCATWGGVPAAAGNPTGAMGLTDYLGSEFRSQAGLPVINLPGCAPPGDNFIETLSYLLLHLRNEVPLELDDLNRPRWLYPEVAHPQPAWVEYLPDQTYQDEQLVACRVPLDGWMNHIGGCTNVGGACIGCTMPGFPDKHLAMNSEQ